MLFKSLARDNFIWWLSFCVVRICPGVKNAGGAAGEGTGGAGDAPAPGAGAGVAPGAAPEGGPEKENEELAVDALTAPLATTAA